MGIYRLCSIVATAVGRLCFLVVANIPVLVVVNLGKCKVKGSRVINIRSETGNNVYGLLK